MYEGIGCPELINLGRPSVSEKEPADVSIYPIATHDTANGRLDYMTERMVYRIMLVLLI